MIKPSFLKRSKNCVRPTSCIIKAFTLIEMVIATGLFAIITLVCMKLQSTMVSSFTAQTERSLHIEQLTNLDLSFKKMFSNMVPFTWRDADNQRVPHFQGDSDYLRFAYLTRLNSDLDGGLRFMEIFINDENALEARYQNRPFLDGVESSEEAFSSVLSYDVASISLRYASVAENSQHSQDLEWLEAWDVERTDIPLAILVNVTWIADESGDQKAESFLWRTSSNSYYERLGAWRNGARTL